MEFVNKTQLQMEPGASEPMPLDSAGIVYDTPAHFATYLGDLSRLSYVWCHWVVDLAADAASTAVATVELLAADTVVASVALDLAGGTRAGVRQSVDISSVPGAAPLTVRVTVTNAAAGGTATVRSWLEIEHPLVIGA